MNEEKLHKIRDTISKYAKAKSERVYLSEYRKSLKAIMMKEAETQGVKTLSAQERDAYSSDKYIELLNVLKDATEIEEKYKWSLMILQQELEMEKANIYQTTAEMKNYSNNQQFSK
jgi:hypothetical protein